MAGGRPPKYNKAFHPEEFVRLSGMGKHKTEIASEWNISRETLYDWARHHKEFSDAIRLGRLKLEAWWRTLGKNAMFGSVIINGRKVDFDPSMFRWLTSNTLGWTHGGTSEAQNDDDDIELDFSKHG